jgi:hypothetical protein
MNKDYVIAKILDVRMEYEDSPEVIEAIDKILKKVNVEVLSKSSRENELTEEKIAELEELIVAHYEACIKSNPDYKYTKQGNKEWWMRVFRKSPVPLEELVAMIKSTTKKLNEGYTHNGYFYELPSDKKE